MAPAGWANGVPQTPILEAFEVKYMLAAARENSNFFVEFEVIQTNITCFVH